MKEIPLTQGKVALVDDLDWTWLNRFKWHALRDGPRYYAGCHRRSGDPLIRMHRLLLGLAPEDGEVDHKNGNGLDNRRYNLRIATREQNCCNRRVSSNNLSGVSGVYWHKGRERWVARVQLNRKRFERTFHHKKDAIKARRDAAAKYFKEFAPCH